MNSAIAHRLEAVLPDPDTRIARLSVFAESMHHIRTRKPDWCLVRFHGRHLRLFAGRLIVMTLEAGRVWLSTDPEGHQPDWPRLRSWQWDAKSYPEYTRVPSRNGYYSPESDLENDWRLIRAKHIAYLDKVLESGPAPDPRTVQKHEPDVIEYICSLFTFTHDASLDPIRFSNDQGNVGLNAERPRSSTEMGERSFRHADVFPFIARLILQSAKHRPDEFVTHDALVEQILQDPAGRSLVASALQHSRWADARDVASNMTAWFSQQISVGRSEWASFFCRERIDNAWAYKPAPDVTREPISGAELAALEGEPRLFFHTRRERNPALVEAKRTAAIDAQGRLQCEACGFTAAVAYSGLDVEICEVHHRRPLCDNMDAVQTRIDDLAILCPNCHRAIHQTRPMLAVEDFRNRMRGED